MPAPPLIKLEVLKHGQVNAVLALTYTVVLFSCIMSVYEDELRFDSRVYSAQYCDTSHPQPDVSCTRVEGKNTSWSASATFENLELYFSLGAHVTRAPVSSVPLGGNASLTSSSVYPYRKYQFFAEVVLFGLAVVPYADIENQPVEIFRSHDLLVLQCMEGQAECRYLTVLAESEYEYQLVQRYSSFNVSIHYYDFDLLDSGLNTALYTFEYHDIHFKIMEMVVHAFFSLSCLCLLCCWWYLLRRQAWENALPEQWWIGFLLFTLFWYQNPFFIPLMLNQVRDLWLMSASTEMFGVACLFVTWLLMVQGMALPSKQIDQDESGSAAAVAQEEEDSEERKSGDDPDSGSRLGLSFPPLPAPLVELGTAMGFAFSAFALPYSRSDWFRFYRWKLLFLAVFVSSTQTLVFLSNNIIYQLQTTEFTVPSIRHYMVSVIMVVVAALCLLVWLVWFFTSIRDTSRHLRKLSYAATRFRQLSFRFFLVQSGGVVIYFCSFIVVRVVRRSVYYGIFTENFASFVMLSTYILVLSYVYLPSDNRLRSGTSWGKEDGGATDVFERYSQRRAQPRPGDSGPGLGYRALSPAEASTPSAGLSNQAVTVSEREGWGAFSGRVTSAAQHFSMERALMLSLFSFQSYFDVPGDEPMSAYGQLNCVEQFGFRVVANIHEASTDCFAIVAQKANKLVIAFRGSVSKTNVMIDLKFTRRRLPFFEQLRLNLQLSMPDLSLDGIFSGQPKVHQGFWLMYDSLRDGILKAVRHVREHERQPLQIAVTGHSAGGACSQLCALEIASEFQVRPEVFTFGAPRLGNNRFAALYTALVPMSYRLVFESDFVTTIPPGLCVFKHAGVEIILDKLGEFVVDPLYVEQMFRDRRLSIRDHRLECYIRGLWRACRRARLAEVYKLPHMQDNEFDDGPVSAPRLPPPTLTLACPGVVVVEAGGDSKESSPAATGAGQSLPASVVPSLTLEHTVDTGAGLAATANPPVSYAVNTTRQLPSQSTGAREAASQRPVLLRRSSSSNVTHIEPGAELDIAGAMDASTLAQLGIGHGHGLGRGGMGVGMGLDLAGMLSGSGSALVKSGSSHRYGSTAAGVSGKARHPGLAGHKQTRRGGDGLKASLLPRGDGNDEEQEEDFALDSDGTHTLETLDVRADGGVFDASTGAAVAALPVGGKTQGKAPMRLDNL